MPPIPPHPAPGEPLPPPHGVLLIGAGGLGCATALALAGVIRTRLTLVDPDRIALSNLHRQILYHRDDLDALKVEQAARRLRHLAPALTVETRCARLDTPEAIGALACRHAVTVDASDNFRTRFAANDAAIRQGFPLIHGAASGFAGQLMTIDPGRSACLRCLFGAPPPVEGPTCQNEGVIGSLVGEVGWLMALETVKLLKKTGQPLWNRLLTIHALTGKRRAVPLRPDPHCPCHPQPGPVTP
ncbi:MAG: HesA/MoeB/ThiF family protein [Magnetococcales bacterium]|nr:HesA/MoeB/ThiF family protein [Magnetococcales bacterium]